MNTAADHPSVKRVKEFLARHDVDVEVRHLSETARSAADAAAALGVQVGQIASSIVFSTPDPLLIITSGRHKVDTELVSKTAGLPKLGRADADFVKLWSGFVIGGVSPVAWHHNNEQFQPKTFIDTALSEHDEIWAAAGHSHVVFRTNYADLTRISNATEIFVGV
jgi:prolyl-tRNA editing enzyme YbaK/EbsC (Cys-tRNA(Pro) deacylase)